MLKSYRPGQGTGDRDFTLAGGARSVCLDLLFAITTQRTVTKSQHKQGSCMMMCHANVIETHDGNMS